MNNRAGEFVTNLSGEMAYKSFKPSPLPPVPPIDTDSEMVEYLVEANKQIAVIESIAKRIPNVNLFVSMYVRKEALLSSQIEGTWPDGTVQTQSGCTIPAGAPLCGDCGNGFRFPPGQARTQQAGLTDFCGAAAPQHRRGAPVSRVWGRHSPTSSRPGEQMSGAKFGPRVDTCSRSRSRFSLH